MTAFKQDQRFAFLLIISIIGGSCILDVAKAQTLTAEDRLSVLKFVGAFMNFLDLELENSTMATPSSTSSTVPVESTTVTSEGSTEFADSSVSPTTVEETSSSSSSSGSTDPGSTTTTEVTTTTVRRRMCFKRFCYKFSSDKGYIV
ncbi:hypothetical protein KR054_010003 [Drosophila jambulina]|nr:hypothetical protein KR054_010003 [Drosophila jambulina]